MQISVQVSQLNAWLWIPVLVGKFAQALASHRSALSSSYGTYPPLCKDFKLVLSESSRASSSTCRYSLLTYPWLPLTFGIQAI